MHAIHYVSLALLPSLASAFSFSFTNTPQQCQDLSLTITGSGSPPYGILIIPFGPSPLPNNVEARRIFSVNFNGTSSSASFPLPFPTDSQFVAVVSDSTGFGTGGTSGTVTVQASADSSCFNATQNVTPDFYFNIQPTNQLVECTPTHIWWDPTTVQGNTSFQGVIPGGQSFSIPVGSLSTVANEGVGFDWTPSVRTGTTLLLLGGDNRGAGTGGSTFYIMSEGSSDSCLSPSSPSSTPGSPAGGSYPTSTGGSDSSTGPGSGSDSSGSHTDVGAIVGGVVGGIVVVAVVVIAFIFSRRRRTGTQQTRKERPVDLLHDNEHDRDDDGTLPQYYEPDPFMMPEPTLHSDDERDTESRRPSAEYRGTRLSVTSGSGYGVGLRAPTPSQTVTSRKSPLPPTLRPVNIIQHDDAGPSEAGVDEEAETIELPPAYTHIRRPPA